MSEAKKPAPMIEIHPGSPEWNAWLKHYRGTKMETRMLLCLGGKTKTGEIVLPRSWLSQSKMPPDAPRAENERRSFAQVAPSSLRLDRSSAPEGKLDIVADRQLVERRRRIDETQIEKRRRKEAKKNENILRAALEAAAMDRTPHVNGNEYLGTLDVEDPLEEQETVRAGRGYFLRKKQNAPRRTRVISLRDDPIGRMAKRGQLGEDAERDIRLKTARHWQRLYEQAEIGGARGRDPMSQRISGGLHMPNTDAMLRASAELNQLCRSLTMEDERLLTWVLEVKGTLKQFAGLFAKPSEREIIRLGRQLAAALDLVAELVGFRHVAKLGRRHCDVHAAMAEAAESLELHRAVQRGRSTP